MYAGERRRGCVGGAVIGEGVSAGQVISRTRNSTLLCFRFYTTSSHPPTIRPTVSSDPTSAVLSDRPLMEGVAVPVPTLPAELLVQIVGLVAKTSTFNFLQADWAEEVDIKTTHALTLTSVTLNEIATPHLYSHVVVPDAQAGTLLLRTLESERWRAGAMAGKARAWVKAASFGRRTTRLSRPIGAFAGDVLGELRLANLQRVAFTGLELGSEIFYRLRGQHRWRPAL